jgi:aminopeptidase N
MIRFLRQASLLPLVLLVMTLEVGLLVPSSLAATTDLRCRWCAMADQAREALAAGDNPEGNPHYSPSREVDILHVALDITPDFGRRTIEGTATLRFKPIARALAELKLDAEEMTIESVTATEPLRRWHYDDHRLVLTFENPVVADRDTTVTIRYRAEPRQGLYFRTPEMGYRPEDSHLWTQGEAIESRHWFPCFDAPNEKFTSEVTCRVPAGMVVRSNGRLMSSTPDPASGRVAVRWLQDKPHVTYLICLVAGNFRGIEDRHRDVPLGFWTPVSQAAWAKSSFRDTRAMMEFFERELGVPFPWAKYDQVVVDDFTAGGMENTSITILTGGTLFPDEYDPVRSSRGLVAHELAHQWFGDLVTCRDWSHLWLNEGFATYYDALQAREQLGRDEFLIEMDGNARSVLSSTDGTPIVWRNFATPMDQFGYRAYPKGSWVLHMLRSQLGEDLFRRCVTTYLQRHAYGVVETSDLQKVIEELSGRSFDRFFDQWLYHGHHPELNVRYSWDETSRLAKISVSQNQKLGGNVMLFDLPLPVRFVTSAGIVEKILPVKAKAEDFQIPLPAAPELVRIDPDLTVLAQVTFDIPEAMLHRQLRATNDVIGRLRAVDALSKKQDKTSVERLREALTTDSSHAVRSKAAGALRTIHSLEAFAALTNSMSQPDPRVRIAMLRAVDGFYREAVGTLAADILERETHPAVQIAAVRLLANPGATNGSRQLVAWLGTNSFRQEIAEAALESLRKREDPTVVPAILAVLKERAGEFPSGVLQDGLSTVAWLSRNEDEKTAARELLVSRVNDPRVGIRRVAIEGLGILGDPRAIPVLETFARATKTGPEQAAATSALGKLREQRRPAAELGELRRELTDLQKENRDLKQEFEGLKKKLDALAPPPAGTNAPPSTNAPPAKVTPT